MKDTSTEHEEVHKDDVRHHDPHEDERFLVAIPFYTHMAKVITKVATAWSYRMDCNKSGLN